MLREATVDDAARIAALQDTVSPEFVRSAASVRHQMELATPGSHSRRWCAEDGDELVGTVRAGLNVQTSEVGVGWIDIATHSVHRGRGIGGALYDVAERHLREVGTRRILTESRADAASIAFAQSRGFAQIPSNDILRLDPRTVRAMSLPTGVDVVPFTSFLDDPAEAVPRRRHRDAR